MHDNAANSKSLLNWIHWNWNFHANSAIPPRRLLEWCFLSTYLTLSGFFPHLWKYSKLAKSKDEILFWHKFVLFGKSFAGRLCGWFCLYSHRRSVTTIVGVEFLFNMISFCELIFVLEGNQQNYSHPFSLLVGLKVARRNGSSLASAL